MKINGIYKFTAVAITGDILKEQEVDAASVVEDTNNLIVTEKENYWYSRGDYWGVNEEGILTYVQGFTDEEMKNLIVPMVVEGELITGLGNNVFKDETAINTVTIPNSVTTIGEGCFSGCTALTSISIPNSVTTIGNNCFNGCTGLTSISIPNSVTTIGNNCFNGCTSLASITIPEGVTTLEGQVFYNCTSLNEINLPSTITTFNFSYPNLQSNINVSENNKVYSSQDGVLFNKDKTELIYFPKIKEGSYIVPESVVTLSKRSFYRTNISEVTLQKNVRTIDEAFWQSKISTINIEEGIETIGDRAFSECQNLNIINLPSSLKTIGQAAFWHCEHVTSVTMKEGVESIGDSAFEGMHSLENITIPNSVTFIGEDAFGTYYHGIEIKLKNIYFAPGDNPIPEGAPWGAYNTVNIEKLTQ